MVIRNCDMYEFAERIKGKRIICIGFRLLYTTMHNMFPELNIHNQVEAFIDNNPRIVGEKEYIIDKEYVIKPFSILEGISAQTHIVLICSRFYGELIQQMDNMECMDEVECYCYPIMHSYTKIRSEKPYRTTKIPVIPKKIHYCWFGGNPMPEFNQRCIESWRRMCPDYEIVCWDETNYDYTRNVYMREAYEHKAWAFVSDYARLDIIHQHGGIYLDTDIELRKNLDELLWHEGFAGFTHHYARINTGVGFGARKGLPLLQEWMNSYKYIHYVNDDGGYNTKLCPVFQTDILRFHKDFKQDGKFQVIDGMALYPKEYFAALSPMTGVMPFAEDAYSIHYGVKSWVEDNNKGIKQATEQAKHVTPDIIRRMEETEKRLKGN